MFLLHKRIANVSASLFTWEVTTAFDGVLTESELQKLFKDEFGTDLCTNRVFFYHLVSFNASDGRKHRYLVATSNELLERYQKEFDRCLPRQVALYAIADKILRGTWSGEYAENAAENDVVGLVGKCAEVCACENAAKNMPVDAECANDGNLLLVALWNETLYVLAFLNGRLCHWSEEHGYGDSFDELCQSRVSRFKNFLKADELFANAGVGDNAVAAHWNESFVNCNEIPNMDKLFCEGANDPFWKHLDLDACNSMKSCEKRRWILFAVSFFALGLSLVLMLKFPFARNAEDAESFKDVAAIELDLPSSDVLNRLSWAKGHRDMLRHERRWNRSPCNLPEFMLLGIVGGRAALVKFPSGETKTLMLGDMINSYRVKSVGKNDVVLRCGGKVVHYEIGSNVGSKISSR